MCAIRDCAVCECDPEEIPVCWREEDSNRTAAATAKGKTDKKAASNEPPTSDAFMYGQEHPNAAHSAHDPVSGATTDADRIFELSRVNFPGEQETSGIQGWAEPKGEEAVNVWTDGTEDEDSPDTKYINLLQNPEGYTGYTGPSARRIWGSIYDENCFPVTGGADVNEMCYEQRVFFRMISGLQTSINTHIAMTYNDGRGSNSEMFDASGANSNGKKTTSSAKGSEGDLMSTASRYLTRAIGILTGRPERSAASHQAATRTDPRELVLHPGLKPNVQMYVQRIGKFPDRMRNLYFTFLFVLRAAAVARENILSMDFTTGNPAEDEATRQLVRRLIDVEMPSVLRGFDESVMFTVQPEDVQKRNRRVKAAADGSCPAPSGRSGSGSGSNKVDVLGDPSELQAAAADLAELTAQKAKLRVVFRDKYRNISRIMGEWSHRDVLSIFFMPVLISHQRASPISSLFCISFFCCVLACLQQTAWAVSAAACGASCSSWAWARR